MIPSEATIENLCNHAIMTGLREEGWSSLVLKPTTHQEKALGFHGLIRSVGGSQSVAVYIQYKRLADSAADDEWLIDATAPQQAALAQFANEGYPDTGIFYAFSRLETNTCLTALATPGDFLDQMVFASAEHVSVEPQKMKRHRLFVRASGDQVFAESQKSRRDPERAREIRYWEGRDWLNRLLDRELGVMIGSDERSRDGLLETLIENKPPADNGSSNKSDGFQDVSGSLLLCRPPIDGT